MKKTTMAILDFALSILPMLSQPLFVQLHIALMQIDTNIFSKVCTIVVVLALVLTKAKLKI